MALYRTPDEFTLFNTNIHIESNNEKQFAIEIQKIIPGLMDSIEFKLHTKYKQQPEIYICNANNSFCKFSGAKYPGPRAKVTGLISCIMNLSIH